MNHRNQREALALRLNDWIAQEIAAGHLHALRKRGGEVNTLRIVLAAIDVKLDAPELDPTSEALVERAIDLPCLTPLRKGADVGARAWMLVAERIGKAGALPTLPEVLAARRAYWAACDAAHDARRAARRHAETPDAPKPAPTTQDAPAARSVRLAEPYKPPRYVEGELVEEGTCWSPELSLARQERWLEAHAELDRPRPPVGEPIARARWADDVASQGIGPRRIREMQARASMVPPAWMDEAPQWGESEEVMR